MHIYFAYDNTFKNIEWLFEDVCSVICNSDAKNDDIWAVQPVIEQLRAYYHSELWQSNYTADENGEIPNNIKRDVLSQNDIYNLLCENDKLLKELKCIKTEMVNKMKKVKITAVRQARYDDLIELYENPIQHACDVSEGMVWIANGWQKPDGFCDSAWESMSHFVMALAHGGENFYNGWMKNPKSAMISCNDGFRPVSFLIETLDENSD